MRAAKLPFRRLKTAFINDRRWKIQWRLPRVPKQEERQNKKNKLIMYGRYSPGRNTLYFSTNPKKHPEPIDMFSTVLHETAHAAFPQMDEDAVTNFELDFMAFIKRLGFQISLDGDKT